MTEQEAREAAESFIATREMRSFTAHVAEVRRRTSNAREWVVVFDVKDSDGARLDGPLVVIVDDASGHARFS